MELNSRAAAGLITDQGSQPKAILFDIGMTLIHPSGVVMVEELHRTRCATGITAPEAEAALAAAAEVYHVDFPRHLSRDDKVGMAWGALLGVNTAAARRAWVACRARGDLYRDLDPEAMTVLRRLRDRGILVAAVSNSEGTLDEELARFGLLKFFDVVVDSSQVGCEKPNSAIFNVALERLQCAGGDVWFVGDGLINDMLGAQMARIARTILYDRHRIYQSIPAVASNLASLGQLLELLPCTVNTDSISARLD